MRKSYKNIFCVLIVAVIIYNIYLAYRPRKIKPLSMKQERSGPDVFQSDYLNADALTNNNAQRFQHNQPDVDRLPLVEENTHILPANEIVPLNYKDCNSKVVVDKEVYACDAPLFDEMGPINLVPLDINDGSHRRINFY